jgi:hypothetical protein
MSKINGFFIVKYTDENNNLIGYFNSYWLGYVRHNKKRVKILTNYRGFLIDSLFYYKKYLENLKKENIYNILIYEIDLTHKLNLNSFHFLKHIKIGKLWRHFTINPFKKKLGVEEWIRIKQ